MWRPVWPCGLPVLLGSLLLASACGGGEEGGGEKEDLEQLRQELAELESELATCQAGGAGTDGAEQAVELESSDTDAEPEGEVIEVDLTEGAMTMEGEQMSSAQLARAVRAAVAKDPSAKVVVTAAPDVEYEKLVEVLDVARVNGVKNMALGDESKKPPRARSE